MKRFLTSVSLQHEPEASDVITLVKKTFFVRVSYKILYHTRSEIKILYEAPCFNEFVKQFLFLHGGSLANDSNMKKYCAKCSYGETNIILADLF